MREQDFDFLSVFSELLVFGCLSNCSGDIAGCFVNTPFNLSKGGVGTALLFERSDSAIDLARPIDDGVGLSNMRS
jgi:hypothetical protein